MCILGPAGRAGAGPAVHIYARAGQPGGACRAAHDAICVRFVKPSLDRMFATCRAAVAGLITSSSAICRFGQAPGDEDHDLVLTRGERRGRPGRRQARWIGPGCLAGPAQVRGARVAESPRRPRALRRPGKARDARDPARPWPEVRAEGVPGRVVGRHLASLGEQGGGGGRAEAVAGQIRALPRLGSRRRSAGPGTRAAGTRPRLAGRPARAAAGPRPGPRTPPARGRCRAAGRTPG